MMNPDDARFEPDEPQTWDHLPEDFCEDAIESTNYEDEVIADTQAMTAAGLDVRPETIDDFYFSTRAVTKLWRKGMSRYDAMQVLSRNKFKKSETDPNNMEAYGTCSIGPAKVAFKINNDESIDAAFAIVTGHPIAKSPPEFRTE